MARADIGMLFMRRTDGKILAQTVFIHTAPIVSDNYGIWRNNNIHSCRIRVKSIIDQFTQKTHLFRIQFLANGDEVAFIDSDRDSMLFVRMVIRHNNFR